MDAQAPQISDRRAVDDELIRRVADGDDRAWPSLVDRHLAAVTAFAWHMLGDRAEAEDVAQEAFVRLFRKVETWQPGGPLLRTWLTRVATNLCIDRARTNRPVPLDPVILEETGDDGEGPLQTRLDQRRALTLAMAGLPVRQRGAVTLVHFQGFSNREAADTLGVSVDALESLLSRARRSLRRSLSPLMPDLLELE